jgi:hypothetical protein
MKTQHIKNMFLIKAAGARNALAAAALLGMSAAAMAQGTGAGWERMFSNLTSLGKTGATAVTALAFLAGLVALAYGGKLLWDKGGERGEDIKLGRIVFTIVGGTVMIALGFVASQTVETLGGQASDIGSPISTK